MRANLRDVARDRTLLRDWWADLPMRRRRWWALLLLDRGQGWLRWSFDQCGVMDYESGSEEWPIAPPARRAWIHVYAWITHPFLALRGDVGWREVPSWSDISWMVDPDRSHHLTERW